jgi:hypothetical protein
VKAILALVIIFAPLAAQAQLLKCVGKDGKVEYAAQCPGGTKEQQTGIKNTKQGPTTSDKGTPGQKSLAERDADFRKRQTEQQDAAAKKAEASKDAEARKANCENARAHLASLETGERIMMVNPDTKERYYMDDAGRQKAIAQARHSVDGWCK